MEIENREKQNLDLLVLFEDFLRQIRRTWLLGMVLILVFGSGMLFLKQKTYVPTYEAYASFTVRVANPLYSSVGTYNEKTAQVMSDTFPSIVTSGLLQQKVMEELGLSHCAYSVVLGSVLELLNDKVTVIYFSIDTCIHGLWNIIL